MTRLTSPRNTNMETNRVATKAPRLPWPAIRARVFVALFAAYVGLCTPSGTRAQTNETAVPRAVTSVLDEQTVAVVDLETARIDLDAALSQISMIPVLSERDRGDLAVRKKQLAQWLDRFHRAGGRDIWIVLTLADADALYDGPLVVVPLHQGADRPALDGLFVKGKLTEPETMQYPLIVDGALERYGALIFGSDGALKRLQHFNGPLRAIPKEALEAVAGAEVRVFLLPTDDQRRVLSEFLRDPQAERTIIEQMPRGTVPPQFLRDPGALARLALTDGFRWLAVGLTTHETLTAKLVIGSKDATSAQALALWMAGAWQFARQNLVADKTAESATIGALIDQLARLLAPKVEGNRLTIRVEAKELIASAAGAFLGQATVGAVKSGESNVVKNHLKQLALAMHNYHDVNKQFPPAAIRDAQGRPLLSWRVSLLPYLEEGKLYRQFHLDEPWDSEHNKKLIAKMPSTFGPRSAELRMHGKTTMLVPIGKQTIFEPKEGTRIRDITDGTSNTILIVNADEDQAVVWTKPEDLNVDGVDAARILFGTRKDGLYCAFADGSVRFLGPQFDSALLHALLTRNGGEPVAWPENH
jgi:hypothetical protein